MGVQCDQIFTSPVKKMGKDTTRKSALVSTGFGRTTCSYFMPDNKHILYASTHEGDADCPPTPESNGKYVWAIYSNFDIYVADLKGNITQKLTNTPGYDAEGTVSPDGKSIVFTSTRTGDLELWIMDIDGNNQRQITTGLGYDGGAFSRPIPRNWSSAPAARKPKKRSPNTRIYCLAAWLNPPTWKFTPATWMAVI